MKKYNLKLKGAFKKGCSYLRSLYAAGMYQAVATLTGDGQSPVLSQLFDPNQSLAGFLNSAFKVAISIGAVVAVLRIAWAGYLYLASDLWTDKDKGREILQDVALGLLLLLAVYIILNQINPDILNLDAFRGVEQAPSGGGSGFDSGSGSGSDGGGGGGGGF